MCEGVDFGSRWLCSGVEPLTYRVSKLTLLQRNASQDFPLLVIIHFVTDDIRMKLDDRIETCVG